MKQDAPPTVEPHPSAAVPTRGRYIVANLVIPALILASTIAIGAVLLRTPPEVARSSPKKLAAVVGVSDLIAVDTPIVIDAYGSVVPSREIRIIPEVAGRIIELNSKLIPGGLINAGEQLFRIDPADYDIAVAQAEADLEVARHEPDRIRASIEALEGRGKQLDVEIANLQWNADRLGKLAERNTAAQSEARDAKTRLESQRAARRTLDADIHEREKAVDAAIAQARVAERRLEAARLRLARTVVNAPFDAIVVAESVELGQLVGSQTSVATLASTDEFWAEAAIPVSRLRDIRFAVENENDPSNVEVRMATGDGEVVRDGKALRPLGDLDPQGRMARVLVSINDPLGLAEGNAAAARRILLGSYVRLKIDAGVLNQAYAIPRKALRENDRIWVRDRDGKLAIRPVKVLWRRHDDVLVHNGFEPGDQLVETHLASVVPGMPLDIREAQAPADNPVAQTTHNANAASDATP